MTTFLVVNLPAFALAFLLVAAVTAFRAPPKARRGWRIAFVIVLLFALATCALVATGLRGLAY